VFETITALDWRTPKADKHQERRTMKLRINRYVSLQFRQVNEEQSPSVRFVIVVATFLGALCLAVAGMLPATVSATAPSQVLVVYPLNSVDWNNNGIGDSRELADYYVDRRGVPSDHVLAVTISVPYGYYYVGEYGTFYNDLVAPIKSKLSQLGPHNIDIILLAGSIPTEVRDEDNRPVAVDSVLMMLQSLNPNSNTIRPTLNPYFEASPTFGADLGHFSHSYKMTGGYDIYLVSRLGSGNALRGIDQIDQAIYAERYLSSAPGSYSGHIYVDSLYGQGGGSTSYTDAFLTSQSAVQDGDYNGPYLADLNIAYTEHYALSYGFPLKWENTTSGVSIGDPGAFFSDGAIATNAPRALFYGGWYNYGRYNDVWDWLPGSVACDLNSGNTFGTGAISHGATAACYVIGEPYLNYHQRPNILIYYLLSGYNFAEASTLSTPGMAWMGINEGDPLYTPLGPKVQVRDTTPPMLVSGYPLVSQGSQSTDRIIHVRVHNSPEPDVVVAAVDYGRDTNYGSTATSGPGYKSRLSFPLSGLESNAVYHYRLRLTDPVGNITTTGDFTFTTGAGPSTPQSIAALAGSGQSTVVGTNFASALQARVTDGSLNPLGGIIVTFAAPSTGASATFNGTYTVTAVTDSTGVATSPIPLANSIAGGFSISASVAGLPAAYFTLTNIANSDFSLSISPQSQSVVQGSSATYTVTVGAFQNFSGSVTLSISGLPSGTTASFSPSIVVSASPSALSVTTSSSTPTDMYTLVISGTSGNLTHNATVTLGVTAAIQADFSISTVQPSQTVARGGKTQYTVLVTPNGDFNQEVLFSVSGLPKGASATFNPSSVSRSGSSVLTVTTNKSKAPGTAGTFTLTIIGKAGGSIRSTNVMLLVTE
jgi:hypothetical protein